VVGLSEFHTVQNSSRVRKNGGVPGPPTRNPRSRIHRGPSGLPTALHQHCHGSGSPSPEGLLATSCSNCRRFRRVSPVTGALLLRKCEGLRAVVRQRLLNEAPSWRTGDSAARFTHGPPRRGLRIVNLSSAWASLFALP